MTAEQQIAAEQERIHREKIAERDRPAEILALPEKERDDEIRKLIVPKPWKHKKGKLDWDDNRVFITCSNCKKQWYQSELPTNECSVLDPIPLDWNLAMKMRDEAVKPAKLAFFLEEVCRAENRMDYQFALWLVWEAQPHHYILAAILAGEE